MTRLEMDNELSPLTVEDPSQLSDTELHEHLLKASRASADDPDNESLLTLLQVYLDEQKRRQRPESS